MRTLLKNGRFGLPAILKFIEYKAIIMMIPERRSPTLSLTWIIPVRIPAMIPNINDINKVYIGLKPIKVRVAVILMPSGKLPSTVISGKSKILYVIYTPKETIEYISPSLSIPTKIPKKSILVKLFYSR